MYKKEPLAAEATEVLGAVFVACHTCCHECHIECHRLHVRATLVIRPGVRCSYRGHVSTVRGVVEYQTTDPHEMQKWHNNIKSEDSVCVQQHRKRHGWWLHRLATRSKHHVRKLHEVAAADTRSVG